MNPNDTSNLENDDDFDTDIETIDEDSELDGEEELFKALKSLRESDDDGDIDEEELDDDVDNEDDLEDEEDFEDDDEPATQAELDKAKGKKREQSKEENARFAAERRQKELDDKVTAKLEELKQTAPEYALAKHLSEMSGESPEQILEQMREAALVKEAEERKIPIELLKERQADRQKVESVEKELLALKYQAWKSNVDSERVVLTGKYSMLDDADMELAVQYVLKHNVNMPLKEAVYAIHGEKIITELAKGKIQDDLAEQGGRKKKTPPALGKSKVVKVTEATAEEKYAAKMFGMSIEDYLKHK